MASTVDGHFHFGQFCQVMEGYKIIIMVRNWHGSVNQCVGECVSVFAESRCMGVGP